MFFKYTVLFKANLIFKDFSRQSYIFKDFSRQSYIFKYFSIKPVRTLKHAILSSADISFNLLFQKLHSAIPSECQTFRIQFKFGILSFLIWVPAVFKGYQQMTQVGIELMSIKIIFQYIAQYYSRVEDYFCQIYLRKYQFRCWLKATNDMFLMTTYHIWASTQHNLHSLYIYIYWWLM